MDRVRFLEHAGHRVLLIDYSGLQTEAEVLEVVRLRREVVAQQSANSLLTLTDATGARFTHAALSQIKQAAVFDRPKLRRAALVGADEPNVKTASQAVADFSARQWKAFPTREAALEWLTSENAKDAEGARAI